MSDKYGHVTRFSDSSLYDEICTKCGATDAMGCDKLDKPCPASRPPTIPENKAPQPPEIMWLQIENALFEHEFTHCAEQINDDDIKYIRTTASDSALKDVGLMREGDIFACDKCGDSGITHEFRGTFNHAIDCSCATNPLSIYSIKKRLRLCYAKPAKNALY